MDNVLPTPKLPPTIIVLWAFDRTDDGELIPAWEARQMPDERRAVMQAKVLARQHDGVICWKREADVAAGEYGPSEVLYRHGSVPDLD